MKESTIAIACVCLAGILVVGTAAGWLGFRMGRGKSESPPSVAPVVVDAPATVSPSYEPDPFPEVSDSEIEELIAETEPPLQPGFDPEEMEARRQRWETMSMEQRRMVRKSMFSALSKVEGLEEVGDAIREGKIDPRQFKIDPEEIADRMEIHAELMDQNAMEQEVTKALQTIVNQARSQLE